MRIVFLLPCLLYLSNFLLGQSATFPQTWEGDWNGTLRIYSKGKMVDSIEMELAIHPIDTSDNWQWQITYFTKKEDIRKYELVTIDAETGHYQVDEKNSILLDSYLFENVLSSRFSVDKSILLINETYLPDLDQIRFEIFSGSLESVETGSEIEEDFGQILSYPVNGYHIATLSRKE